MNNMINHPGVIIGFAVVVIVMLLLDLGVFNKKVHAVTSKEAAIWSVVWITLSMVFSGVIYLTSGFEKFTQFQSAYWIEKALSVDNLFVFILVFGFFKVPKELHHKVLFWGIIGALVFRAIFIFAGVGLINLTYLPETVLFGYTVQINVVLFLFGLFLIYAGIKSWSGHSEDEENKDFSKSPGARVIYKFFKVSKEFDGAKFFTVENGIRMATPLLVVVAVIEFTDLLFAVDSIPAIFAIAPDDPLILYTSNIFAILGLRALYFLLANFIHMFSLLKYGLAIILAFIGIKMVISPFYHISSPLSLSIVGAVLVLSVIASLIFPPKEEAVIK
ncbi:MAG: TerC/Alx family metal homeostasis membrane protein [Candidatus Pedobacter colombiensis]|uniref:TerC/Alx family metal homeostasis membrane protein n=1 Tax=Candidatus Pedobacter colombiensis TaxID=3121371 RepID=A0AAJ5WAS5_9SPHI|nr:TerC/Alx family metal homeostasis membrane protein [Pedobacter sp.]WEK21186.1 MAG: TerC/Alx family metal homeostasis membrane protein [Pedobacter sp.]